jgi:hypothetical protein
MVTLRAQVWHSELPPKGCMGVKGGHPSDEARTFCRSPDGEAASASYLGNLHNSAAASVLLRVAHLPHSCGRTAPPSGLDNTWTLDMDI